MFVMLISAKECDKQKASATSDNISEVTTTDMSKREMQDQITLNYRAATRGFYLEIWIEGDSIKHTTDHSLKAMSTHKIPSEEKEALMSLLSDLNVNTLPELEAPSKRFQFDGAAITTFEVTKGEDSYKTVAFDHGNPPESIKAIVEKILSIKTMFEKQ